MKKILFALSLTLLFACGSDKVPEVKQTPKTTDYLLEDNAIAQLLAAKRQSLTGIKGNLASFKKYLVELNNDSVTSIPFALEYIKTCIPADDANRDSVYIWFSIKFYAVTNSLNGILDTKYKTLVDQLNKDSATAELKCFKNNLAACGIGIFSTEGMFYLDVEPDYFYSNFKNRVSEGTREYLSIRKDELKEGFSEDAGMLISFEDLHKRIKRWENFNNKYPNTPFNAEAASYYQIYLETLMTGMDNSRIFEFEQRVLLPEIKTLYENIMKEDPASPTTKMITAYYAFLTRHDFKDNDSIQPFLKANNLSTMLAVQPHNR